MGNHQKFQKNTVLQAKLTSILEFGINDIIYHNNLTNKDVYVIIVL